MFLTSNRPRRFIKRISRNTLLTLVVFLGGLGLLRTSRAIWHTSALVYLPYVSGGNAMATARPSWGAPIALSPDNAFVWVVNPDSNSVSVFDTRSPVTPLSKTAEIAVGREPWSVALSPDGLRAYVLNRADGTLSLISTRHYTIERTLPIGPEPIALALAPSGAMAYITVLAADELAVIDTHHMTVTTRMAVATRPYGIAISNDGDSDDSDEQIYVTHVQAFARAGGQEARDDGREGRITVLSLGNPATHKTITLAPDINGFPNLLSAISLQPGRAWVPAVRALPDAPNTLTQVVFASVSAIDTVRNTEAVSASLPLNDQDIFGSPVNNPVAVVPAPNGKTVFVVLAGSNLIEVVDVAQPQRPRLVKFIQAGKNPRGLVMSSDGAVGYVMNYLARSITVLNLITLQAEGDVPTTHETLSAAVLRGKELFNAAGDPRIAGSSWVSCASCHADGGSDGVTWMFPDGPRQTPPLWNTTQTLPWHWSAALDEPQDVENTIQDIQHGIGLAMGEDPPQLGQPNAGRSADLDALAVFMAQGIRTPTLAQPVAVVDVAAGRQVFARAGCAACHAGNTWTMSQLPGKAGTLDADGNGMVDSVLRDVGTLNPRDLRGTTGFDVPSLLNVGLTAPYLHDGSAATLRAVVESGHPTPNAPQALTVDEVRQLVAFLSAIGADTPPVAFGAQ